MKVYLGETGLNKTWQEPFPKTTNFILGHELMHALIDYIFPYVKRNNLNEIVVSVGSKPHRFHTILDDHWFLPKCWQEQAK